MKELSELNLGFVAPFYHKRLSKKYLLTNDWGYYIFLTEKEWHKFISGSIRKGTRLYEKLKERGFIRSELDFDELSKRYRKKVRHVLTGPSLNIVILTLHCNQDCLYCQTSRKPEGKAGYKMDLETAKKVMELIERTAQDSFAIEFQGGEPLLNFEVMEYFISRVKELRKSGRDVDIYVVSNFTLMDDKKLDALIDAEAYICTSLDGPGDLHDRNRPMSSGSSYDHVIRWIDRIRERYQKLGISREERDVDALVTISKYSLSRGKEIVDEYIKREIKVIHLRPIQPFGFATRTWKKIGYTANEFLNFYKRTTDYIIQQALTGKKIMERQAAILLAKIIAGDDPMYVDLMSPCGAAIAQVAYNYDGRVFTCDEGRMIAEGGDPLFCMGCVDEGRKVFASSVVKSMLVASELNGLPGCSECVYKPYCGVCPVYNYAVCGDLVAQGVNDRCRILMGQMDYLFSKLASVKSEVKGVLEEWAHNRFYEPSTPFRD